MKYKVILFDVDGVLVKDEVLFTQQYDLDHDAKSVEVLAPFFKNSFMNCKLGKVDTREELAKYVTPDAGLGSVNELMDYWLSKGTEINDQIFDYAKSLKAQNLKLFITSSQERYRGEHLRKVFCSDGTFDEIFFSAEIGYVKEDQEFWEYVLKNIDEVSKGEVLVIDDDSEVIESAKKFGFDIHLFTSLDGLKSEL